MEKLLTPKEVARILNCNTETVRRYCREGLMNYKKWKRKIYIPENELTVDDTNSHFNKDKKKGLEWHITQG